MAKRKFIPAIIGNEYIQNKATREVVTNEEWNNLFNLNITQGNNDTTYLAELQDFLFGSEGFDADKQAVFDHLVQDEVWLGPHVSTIKSEGSNIDLKVDNLLLQLTSSALNLGGHRVATNADLAPYNTRITEIEGKIPSGANPANKLVTETTLNSTVNTAVSNLANNRIAPIENKIPSDASAANKLTTQSQLSPVSTKANEAYALADTKADNMTYVNNHLRLRKGTVTLSDVEISGSTGEATWGMISGDIDDQTDLKNKLDSKQPTISDLSDIRTGASLGATSVQPADISDMATKTYVDGELEGKADNMTYEDNILSLKSGSTTLSQVEITGGSGAAVWGGITGTLSDQTDLNTALGGKQATISDLDDIRSGAGLGATAVQPDDISDMATMTWVDEQGFATGDDIPDVIDNVTSTSTEDALSAKQGKLLNDRIDNISGMGRWLSLWNCVTGLPLTNPTSQLPYAYRTGDFYKITTVGTTNYMPEGTQYTGEASTTPYTGTETIERGDIWFYDGAVWTLTKGSSPGEVLDVQINGTSILSGGIADIPLATASAFGVVKPNSAYGTYITATNNNIAIYKATDAQVEAKSNGYCPVVPSNLDKAVMEGLGNNALSWTDAYKTSARTTIGAVGASDLPHIIYH